MNIIDETNKKHIWGALRCAEREYNKEFINYGRIKFGTPQKWADEGERYGHGRGDIFEGTFFSCYKEEENFFDSVLSDVYGIKKKSIDKMYFDGRVYYKDKRAMQLPTFCLYGGTFDIFNIQEKTGWQKVKGLIPPKYFQSFAAIDGKEISELPENKQPSVVYIKNVAVFKQKLYSELKEIGVKEKEIICEFVHYDEFLKYGTTGWLDIRYNRPFPKELFVKEKQFEYQSEIRFVINSSNKGIIKYLHKNTINIGDLSGIAQYADGYFEDGICMEIDINLAEKELNE